MRVLVPILDSYNALPAVNYLIAELRRGERVEAHLLHVRAPLPRYAARWIPGVARAQYHRDAAAKVLRPLQDLLDAFHVPYAVHVECGDRAAVIVAMARRLRAQRIVFGVARDNSLTRFLEDPVIDEVTDGTLVPVDVVGGRSVSRLERFGVPLGLGAALGLLWLRLSD